MIEDMNEEVNKCKMCLICRDGFAYGIQWEYPEMGHHKGTMHFTLGNTWEPLKTHPLYKLHLKMVASLFLGQ